MKVSIIGSAKSSGYSSEAEQMAIALGEKLAEKRHTILYGPELEMPSLSYLAAKSAKKHGGMTIAIAIGKARTPFYDPMAAGFVIYTDAAGGAGREVVLINSSDGVLSIGGGSGTLTELAIAYMNAIPIVSMANSGGWSDKLIGHYLDDRKKYKILGATCAEEAVMMLESTYQKDKPSEK